MRGDHGGTGLRRRHHVVGVGHAADVVAHHRTLGIGGAGDRGAPGVDRDGCVEALAEAGHHRHHAIELFGLVDLRSWTRLHSADVEDVSSFGHELLGAGVERAQLEGSAAVVERVGRAVEDPHDKGAVGEVIALAAEVQHRSHAPGPGREPGPGAARVHQ